MRFNRKQMVVVTLAVCAVVFGLIGTVAPSLEPVSQEQSYSSSSLPDSSNGVAHFAYPPTYDSGWVNITDKCGQFFNVTHSLGTKELVVDVTGKQTPTSGEHQKNLGGTNYEPSWSRVYGTVNYDEAMSLVQTSDEGYALAGCRTSTALGYDFWLVKTDASGNMQWDATYGGASDDGAYSVIQTDDGGYALAGYTYSFGSGSSDVLLVKTDSSGVMQWRAFYGGEGFDEACSMVQTSDDGYALAGQTYSFELPSPNYWLIKTDLAGTMEWSRTYGPGGGRSMIRTVDGGFAIAGNGFASLIKVDSNGNLQWVRKYGGTVHSVVQVRDGGFALAGLLSNDFWLMKSDVESGLAWVNTTNSKITLYRGATDADWNFVRVRIWTIQEPTWQYGDVNQDGIVDAKDFYILSRNYGKTFSLLSLSGVVGIAGVQTYQKRKTKRQLKS